MPQTPASSRFAFLEEDDVPIISSDEAFQDVILKLTTYISKSVDSAFSYEQLRTSIAGERLRPLIARLSDECHHQGIVAALLAAAYTYRSVENSDSALCESRALACELVAWQFLTFLSQKELIDYLLTEVTAATENTTSNDGGSPELRPAQDEAADETRPLLENHPYRNGIGPNVQTPQRRTFSTESDNQNVLSSGDSGGQPSSNDTFSGMNALELAAIADAKKFISQRPVQKVIEDIWTGNVIFWDSLSVHATKKARVYSKRHGVSDPWVRLRVPKYQKAIQVGFFISFLALYYAVLAERNPNHVTAKEVFLFIWIAAFAYDEFGEMRDAGLLFYQADVWSIWDGAIILVGIAFCVTRIVGLVKHDDYITDVAFDVLSLAALFLVPRICSVASLNSYYGSLIPVLREMVATFCKFLPVILVLYLGFLSCFATLARDRLTLSQMSFILVEMFFGSSYKGFEVAVQISPIFGYTLMIIFVALTNIVLITVLISLVSNTVNEILSRSREEYLFQYSIYVLESSTSRRLTYYSPPLNLVPLLFIRPLRLVLPAEEVRRIRILALKATHLPIVALLMCYEGSRRLVSHDSHEPQLASIGSSQSATRTFNASQPSLEQDRLLRRSAATASVRNTTNLASAPGDSALRETDSLKLIALVQKLSTQVDELTAMVAGQKAG